MYSNSRYLILRPESRIYFPGDIRIRIRFRALRQSVRAPARRGEKELRHEEGISISMGRHIGTDRSLRRSHNFEREVCT